MKELKSIAEGSLAEEAGITTNDTILSINNHKIKDVLDYQFYTADETLEIELQDRIVIIEKDIYEDLGIEFDTYLIDEKHNCRNKCIFCFIDQLPPNLRETLYFKDDDARLSFLQGNYITLTNLNDDDVKRIIDMKLSVNVSVHTTNPELRCKMMGNRFAGEKLEYLYEISRAARQNGENVIPINTQIVLCKGWNDGVELFNTLRDLNSLDNIQSIAVVPIGMTKFRENLTQIEPFTKDDAIKVIETVGKFKRAYVADEFYLLAGIPIHPHEHYKDYPQYENGVGMLRYQINDFEANCDDIDLSGVKNFSVATGAAAFEVISDLCIKLQKKTKTQITVYKIKNNFFGEKITVAGLLTATDIIGQLRGKNLGEFLLLSSNMLNADGLFLDNLTPQDIEKELNVKTQFVEFLSEIVPC